jgi:hypothetical protein
MSPVRVSLFVLDTGPLITLAAADSLDYLLYPNAPVVIPDAVFYEATRDSAKLGAQSIIDWVKAHHVLIEIAVTNTYVNFDAARTVIPVPMSQILVNGRPWKLLRNRRAFGMMTKKRFFYAKRPPLRAGSSCASATRSSN